LLMIELQIVSEIALSSHHFFGKDVMDVDALLVAVEIDHSRFPIEVLGSHSLHQHIEAATRRPATLHAGGVRKSHRNEA